MYARLFNGESFLMSIKSVFRYFNTFKIICLNFILTFIYVLKQFVFIFRRLIAIRDEHKKSECCGFWCQLILSLFGITFLCTGIIMADLWPQIYGDIMKNVIINCILPILGNVSLHL